MQGWGGGGRVQVAEQGFHPGEIGELGEASLEEGPIGRCKWPESRRNPGDVSGERVKVPTP